MKSVKFKNVSAIIGLAWHVLPGDQSERSAIKGILEQNKGAKAGAMVKYNGVSLMGLGPSGVKAVRGPSAAAWLSLANQRVYEQAAASGAAIPSTGSGSTNDWIVVENLGDGTFWLVIIRDGVPLPGTDVAYDRETTLDLINEAIETVPFIVYSPDEGIRGDVPAGTLVDDKGFADLVQGVKPSKAAVKPIGGVSMPLLMAIAGLLVLGLGWFGYNYWSNQQQAKRMMAQASAQQEAQRIQMEKDKAEYAAAVKEAVNAALDKGFADLDASLSTPSVDDTIASWVSVVSSISANQNGWDVQRFDCSLDGEGRPSCVMTLNRSQFSNNRILLQDHPEAIIEGDRATVVFTGDSLPPRQGDYRAIERAKSFNLDFVSDLQMLHLADIGYRLSESSDVTSPISMPALPASIFKPGSTAQTLPPPAPIKMSVAQGSLNFEGSSLWQAEGLREFLAKNNISVQSMEIFVSNGTPDRWSIVGNYFIRNAPEPILPVILGPDETAIPVSLPDKYKASPEELASWSPDGPVSAASAPAPAPAAEGSVEDALSPLGDTLEGQGLGQAPEEPQLP